MIACQPLHRFFFALRPPRRAATYIDDSFAWLGSRYRRVTPGRLHLTLNILDDWPVFPSHLLRAMVLIGDAFAADPFRVIFDQLSGNGNSVVLRPSERIGALHDFQLRLAEALARAGVPTRIHTRFSPHLTLLYQSRPSFVEPADAVSWTVEEFVLIESLVGWGVHIERGRWSLGGAGQAICATSKLPAGSGLSSSGAGTTGSSQRAQSAGGSTTGPPALQC